MTALLTWYYASDDDGTGADSGAHPGGNGHGCGQIPWITDPTPPPGIYICFSFSLHISFVSSACVLYSRSQRLHPSVEMVTVMETNGERETSAKRTSPMHPSTSYDMSVTICEGL